MFAAPVSEQRNGLSEIRCQCESRSSTASDCQRSAERREIPPFRPSARPRHLSKMCRVSQNSYNVSLKIHCTFATGPCVRAPPVPGENYGDIVLATVSERPDPFPMLCKAAIDPK